MKRVFLLLTLILLCSCHKKEQTVTTDFSIKWDSVRVLQNPDKGWYHHLYDNGISKYAIRNDSLFRAFPGMDHLYLRLAWSYLEPEEGQYDWHRIDSIISKYVPLGYGIAFRITSKETGRFPGSVNQQENGIQHATPVWVKKAGAKGTVAEKWETKSWTPDWDDPVYLARLENFIKAFAGKYDGKPYLRYVDIGSIGDWGEGHTSSSTKVPPTPGEVKANIDIYLKHFRNSQLVVTDDLLYYGKKPEEARMLLDYCVENGITLRDDSPMVNWYIKTYLKTWSVSHPHFFDPLYKTRPIIFELEHYHLVKRDSNWLGLNGADTLPGAGYPASFIMRKAIETLHATYIGYHGYCEEWFADNPNLTSQLLNLCGYWYFPVSISYDKRVRPGERFITFRWINKGVAPAYNDYSLVFRFRRSAEDFFEYTVVDSENRYWLPGKVSENTYKITIPRQVASGRYDLLFKMVKQTSSGHVPVTPGVGSRFLDSEGFIKAGRIKIENHLK